MSSSDSEDDFMSDKFLVDIPKQPPKTYSDRRNAANLASHRKAQLGQQKSHKQIEEERRREGLSTSLFDQARSDTSNDGGPKALQFMQKMGWTPGEGLGKKRSESPPQSRKRKADENGATIGDEEEDGDEEQEHIPRGLGSKKGRIEPIRISLWQGRKGISARSPSPPPLPTTRDHHILEPKRFERLGKATDDFRTRQRREFEEREVEKKEMKARDQLVTLDEQRGVKFHPLHILPLDPLGSLLPPLLKLIYPTQALSPISPPHTLPSLPSEPYLPVSAPEPTDPAPPLPSQPVPERGRLISNAEKLRDQMRREMLTELRGGGDGDDGDGDEEVKFGIPTAESDRPPRDDEKLKEPEKDYGEVDWEGMVSGAKRVLRMDPREHLRYLISQLRNEHLYCLWCSFKYGSFEEMDGPGGCPGEEEDDH